MPTITTPGIDELTLPNHPETKVWLKQRPKFGDKNRVEAAAVVARREVGPGKYATDSDDFARYLNLKVVVMIHDWTVTDEAGKRAPIVVEALESLDPEDGEFLSVEAKKRYDGEPKTVPLADSSETTSTTESKSPTPEPSESPASENS